MGRLIYAMNVSLDGFVETPDRSLEWTVIDDEIHSWWNDHLRAAEASLYGRRVYELMNAYWPTADDDPEANEVMREFAAIWNPMPKVVFSHTLQRVEGNSRLVRGDVAAIYRELRTEFAGDLDVAGPDLAGQFARQGLVDDYRLVVHPVILGAGTPFWPRVDAPLRVELVETHRFASGAVYLGYRSAG
jgi:dihydrofolate reductase